MNLNFLFTIMREGKGLTQQAIADVIGVSRTAVAHFERGQLSALSSESLLKAAPVLSINPSFITGESLSPFYSEDVIKVYLKGSFPFQVELSPLYSFLQDECEVFLLSPPLNIFERVRKVITDEAVYAIVIKDEFQNTLIFRHKKLNVFILPDNDAIQRLTRFPYSKLGFNLKFYTVKINKDLYLRIKDWTINKSDLEFLLEHSLLPLSNDEENFIREIRKRGINIKELRDNIHKSYPL